MSALAPSQPIGYDQRSQSPGIVLGNCKDGGSPADVAAADLILRDDGTLAPVP